MFEVVVFKCGDSVTASNNTSNRIPRSAPEINVGVDVGRMVVGCELDGDDVGCAVGFDVVRLAVDGG